MKLWKPLSVVALLLPLTLSAHFIGQTHFDWTHNGLDVNGVPTTLTGYTIHCGNQSGNYTISYPVLDPNATMQSTSEMGLEDGKWFCAITAADIAGVNSDYSNEVNFRLVGGVKYTQAAPAAPSNFQIVE